MTASVMDNAQVGRSDYADPSYRSVREIERDTKPLYQRSDPSYRAQLGAWYTQIMRDYRACVPQNYSFSLNFADGQKSDWDLYREAMGVYNSVLSSWHGMQYNMQSQEEKPVKYHLRSVQLSDGSVYFIDMNGHSEADVKLIRRNDGFYDFIGTQAGLERTGGRGVISDLVNKLEDGAFFHTSQHQKKAA